MTKGEILLALERARAGDLAAVIAALESAAAPKSRSKANAADPFPTAEKALAAWYAAAGSGPRISGGKYGRGWPGTVADEFGKLPRAEFAARMQERIDGTRALWERQRAAERAAGLAMGPGGEAVWNPLSNQWEWCDGTGPERDAAEARIYADRMRYRAMTLPSLHNEKRRKRAAARKLAREQAASAAETRWTEAVSNKWGHVRRWWGFRKVYEAIERSREAREARDRARGVEKMALAA